MDGQIVYFQTAGRYPVICAGCVILKGTALYVGTIKEMKDAMHTLPTYVAVVYCCDAR